MTEFDYDCLQKMLEPRAATLPCDSLDHAALVKRNGPCRTYRLNRPMEQKEFEELPVDLQRTYLRRLRGNGGSESDVEQMLGLCPERLRRYRVNFDRPDPTAWSGFLRCGKKEE